MDLRTLQQPIKERYRSDPEASRITLRAGGAEGATPMACSVEVGRALHEAEAHAGVGGPGLGACSGDMLLGALAACAQITCQMVAAAIGVEARSIEVEAEGDLDLQGTLGTRRDVPVGFQDIRLRCRVDAPGADEDQLAALARLTERYCVVMQTLADPPPVRVEWA